MNLSDLPHHSDVVENLQDQCEQSGFGTPGKDDKLEMSGIEERAKDDISTAVGIFYSVTIDFSDLSYQAACTLSAVAGYIHSRCVASLGKEPKQPIIQL